MGGRKESKGTGWVWQGRHGIILNGAGDGRQKRCTERGAESGGKAVKGVQGWMRDGIWAKILT